jgi:hypothetical protein
LLVCVTDNPYPLTLPRVIEHVIEEDSFRLHLVEFVECLRSIVRRLFGFLLVSEAREIDI